MLKLNVKIAINNLIIILFYNFYILKFLLFLLMYLLYNGSVS